VWEVVKPSQLSGRASLLLYHTGAFMILIQLAEIICFKSFLLIRENYLAYFAFAVFLLPSQLYEYTKNQ
jgi:hypothetical protein